VIELNECINFLLTKAQMAVTQDFKTALAPYDITPVQCGVLNCLYKEDGLGLKALCDRLAVNASTMTGVVDRLEAKGIVERRLDPTDRRALAVFLTQKGKDLEAITTKTILESNEFVTTTFTKDEVDELKVILRTLAERAYDSLVDGCTGRED
jgi:MarR family transcriptional regulator, organic hydroperoxide resistance regulator